MAATWLSYVHGQGVMEDHTLGGRICASKWIHTVLALRSFCAYICHWFDEGNKFCFCFHIVVGSRAWMT